MVWRLRINGRFYEAIVATPGHHSPETVYAEVRRRTPSVSLATVYKNLRLFVEHDCCGK
jgi:Fur family peroxide stress response transcriptional regulator